MRQAENSLYRSYIQPTTWGTERILIWKYWPDIADLLQVLGGEDTEVQIPDEATVTIVSAMAHR